MHESGDKIGVYSGRWNSIRFFCRFTAMDLVGILLGKVDAETNQNKPQGSATLQGAQFTVKYYAGLWEANKDPATLGKTPSRTWVFQTDKDGYTSHSKNYLVTGRNYIYLLQVIRQYQ